jgi:cell division protein FtsL
VLSAFLVIQYAHNHRQLSIEQEKLIKERDQLDIEWRHIVLEQSALTEHNRIENTVREKLGMIRPDPEDEVVVKIQ